MPRADHDPDARGSRLAERGRRRGHLDPRADRGDETRADLTAESLCDAGRDASSWSAFSSSRLRINCILSSTQRTVRPIVQAISALVKPSSFQSTICRSSSERPCSSRSSSSRTMTFSSGLGWALSTCSSIHCGKQRSAAARPVAGRGRLAADVAAGRHVPVSGVHHLAHRDSHQQLPELRAAGRRRLALELAHAEAGVHALQDVLLVLAAADPVVEVPAHQRLKARREPLPDHAGRFISLAAIGRTQVVNAQRQRTYRAHDRSSRT